MNNVLDFNFVKLARILNYWLESTKPKDLNLGKVLDWFLNPKEALTVLLVLRYRNYGSDWCAKAKKDDIVSYFKTAPRITKEELELVFGKNYKLVIKCSPKVMENLSDLVKQTNQLSKELQDQANKCYALSGSLGLSIFLSGIKFE